MNAAALAALPDDDSPMNGSSDAGKSARRPGHSSPGLRTRAADYLAGQQIGRTPGQPPSSPTLHRMPAC